MVMPGMLSASRTARLLDVPESFLGALSEHHALPIPLSDGSYDARMVRVAMERLPWLRRLGVPLCDRELARIDPRLTVPPFRGFEWASRRYCRLWECLDHAWGLAF